MSAAGPGWLPVPTTPLTHQARKRCPKLETQKAVGSRRPAHDGRVELGVGVKEKEEAEPRGNQRAGPGPPEAAVSRARVQTDQRRQAKAPAWPLKRLKEGVFNAAPAAVALVVLHMAKRAQWRKVSRLQPATPRLWSSSRHGPVTYPAVLSLVAQHEDRRQQQRCRKRVVDDYSRQWERRARAQLRQPDPTERRGAAGERRTQKGSRGTDIASPASAA